MMIEFSKFFSNITVQEDKRSGDCNLFTKDRIPGMVLNICKYPPSLAFSPS